MRLYEFHLKSRLDEMNVANGDALSKHFAAMFTQGIKARGSIDPALSKLFLKRALRAFQNDETGRMVHVMPLEGLPENAPAWMVQAMQRGETVVDLELRPELNQKIPHILDWLVADAGAINAVRTVPEATFIESLYQAADKYYALQSSRFRDSAPIDDEAGREVVLTFRAKDDEPPQMFEDKSLKPNEHGKVVMFWAKLTNDVALAREGSLMGHCVGGDNYVRAVKHDKATIFSLRDAKNKPHVTVEAQGGRGDWTINQVKGKGNQAPVAKYAPFVKAFLNEVGATANGNGVNDIRGIGLFHANGRYGTPEEVGAKVGMTFKNGDTLRVIDETPANDRGSARGRMKNDVQTELSYNSKDGTHPLSVTIKGEFQGEHMINASVTGVEFFRSEQAKGALVQNLASYLNEANVACSDRGLEKIGLYYNAKTKVWGGLDEAAERAWEGQGVTAFVLRHDVESGSSYNRTTSTSYETVFADKEQRPLFVVISSRAPGKSSWNPIKINQINTTEIAGHLTDILVSYLNNVGASLPTMDDSKDLLRQMGVATNRQGEWVTPEELKPLFSCKQGSVRVSGAFLYVLDKDGTTLLGLRTKNKTIRSSYSNSRGHGREHSFQWIDPNKAQTGMEILYGFSQANPEWKFEDCTDRTFIEMGYVDRADRLVSVAELSKKLKVRGHTVEAEVTPNGTTYTMSIGHNLLRIDADVDNHLKSVTHQDSTPLPPDPNGPEEDENEEGLTALQYTARRSRNRARRDYATGTRVADESVMRPYLPLIMKAAGISCKRSQLIKHGLKEVNGKAVALDAKKDADLIGFFNGKMDLGHGLEWKRDYRQAGGYSHTRGTTRQSHHLPTIGGEIQSTGDYRTLIEINANDPQKHEDNDKWTPEFSYEDPSIKIRRNLPDDVGVTREQLYKVATNFLRFYHEKVMPMEKDDQDYVGA